MGRGCDVFSKPCCSHGGNPKKRAEETYDRVYLAERPEVLRLIRIVSGTGAAVRIRSDSTECSEPELTLDFPAGASRDLPWATI